MELQTPSSASPHVYVLCKMELNVRTGLQIPSCKRS